MALAFVESKKAANATGSQTLVFTNTFAVGQVVYVVLAYDGGANATTSVVDNATTPNTYTLQASLSGLVSTAYLAVYKSTITTAKATPTITVTYNSAATNCNMVAQYFNGFVSTPTVDQQKFQANATSTSITSGATGVIGNAVELVIGMGLHTGAVTTTTAGSGFTNFDVQETASAAPFMESLVTSSAAAQTATASLALTRVNGASVVTLNDGALPSGTTPHNLTMMGIGK